KITSGDDNCFYPAVSMEGKYLSYVSDKLERFELFVKNLDERMGSGETRKTNSQKNKMNFSPFWLHNDREVGFFSNRYNDKYWHLFTSNRGTGVTILTTGLDITENTENFNLFGSCSTDGRIVFTVKFPQDELYLLYLLDLNDNSLTQLRPGMFPDIRDDDRIVFSSDETGNFEIWMVQLEGRSVFRPTILTSNPSYDFDPALSPDGSMIAFASNRSGNTDIWVMNSDGTNLRQITYHPMADRRPQWVNSQEVIFQSNRGLDKDGNPVTNIYKIRVGR
ncbi:MAG: TolB family protein, partial [bacterium]